MMANSVQEFLLEKAKRKSAATVYQYRFILERVWLPWCEAEGVMEPAQATKEVMDRFTDYLEKRQKSIHTVRTYIRGVHTFLRWADVPRGRYEPPKAPARLLEVLTRQEIAALEAVASDERDRLLVRVLAETGVRISELLGLKRSDLREDRHNRTTAIRVVGKGNKEREVPVPPKLFSRLKHYAEHGGQTDAEYIFCSKRLKADRPMQLTRNGVDQLMHELARRAKINKRVYAHLLRHSYATRKLSKGMNPVTLQTILGHSDLSMISKVYSHLVLTDTHRAMMETLDDE
jgi:site-specific recombinase XerD